jgi:hypothetical protein
MLWRCENKDAVEYKYYGGRGIFVCERWHSFVNFYADMGERPIETSLDRIDNNKGYFAENCRWASRAEQARNRSNNRLLSFHDEVKTLTDWAIEFGLTHRKLYSIWQSNHKKGIPDEEILFPFIKSRKGLQFTTNRAQKPLLFTTEEI